MILKKSMLWLSYTSVSLLGRYAQEGTCVYTQNTCVHTEHYNLL